MYHRFKWTRVSRRRNWISQEYEPLQPFFFIALAKSAGATSFVDVGANVGLYSVFMSQAVEQIVAYEANPKLQDEIGKNFSLNQIVGNIRSVAVSDTSGRVTFGIVSDYAGNSAVIDDRNPNNGFASSVTVEAVTLDEELQQTVGPIALKIDVEGHEMPVLRGASAILREKPCILQIEDFEDRVDVFLSELNYRKLTQIGPDSYFTNIESLDPLAVYETAASALIESNHENKTMVLGANGLGVILSGRVYHFVKAVAQRIMGRRL